MADVPSGIYGSLRCIRTARNGLKICTARLVTLDAMFEYIAGLMKLADTVLRLRVATTGSCSISAGGDRNIPNSRFSGPAAASSGVLDVSGYTHQKVAPSRHVGGIGRGCSIVSQADVRLTRCVVT